MVFFVKLLWMDFFLGVVGCLVELVVVFGDGGPVDFIG